MGVELENEYAIEEIVEQYQDVMPIEKRERRAINLGDMTLTLNLNLTLIERLTKLGVISLVAGAQLKKVDSDPTRT